MMLWYFTFPAAAIIRRGPPNIELTRPALGRCSPLTASERTRGIFFHHQSHKNCKKGSRPLCYQQYVSPLSLIECPPGPDLQISTPPLPTSRKENRSCRNLDVGRVQHDADGGAEGARRQVGPELRADGTGVACCHEPPSAPILQNSIPEPMAKDFCVASRKGIARTVRAGDGAPDSLDLRAANVLGGAVNEGDLLSAVETVSPCVSAFHDFQKPSIPKFLFHPHRRFRISG